MRKNIVLSYVLASLKNSWFFLGVWVFYYLLFTNYAGIGMIESVLILTLVLTEVPTGAIADLIGKKITLIFSFFLMSACNILMAFSPNFTFLVISVFLGGIGMSLYSGTMDALVFDSLKQEGKEKRYSQVLGNMVTLQYLMMAATSSIGGFMYAVNPRLPFIASGAFCLLGFIFAFFLREPLIDTEKFSLKNFVRQNKRGFSQLFGKSNIRQATILLLIIAAFAVIADEVLNDILGVEFGFNSRQLGIFIAAVSLISSGISQLAPKIIKRFKKLNGAVFFGLLIGLTYLVSPWAGIVIGGLSLLLRVVFQTIFNNLSLVTINSFTESKDRSTTISSFNMIKSIPYILTAYSLGFFMDTLTARNFAFILGFLMLILIFIQTFKARGLKFNAHSK